MLLRQLLLTVVKVLFIQSSEREFEFPLLLKVLSPLVPVHQNAFLALFFKNQVHANMRVF